MHRCTKASVVRQVVGQTARENASLFGRSRYAWPACCAWRSVRVLVLNLLGAGTASFESFCIRVFFTTGKLPCFRIRRLDLNATSLVGRKCSLDYCMGYCFGCFITYWNQHCKPFWVVIIERTYLHSIPAAEVDTDLFSTKSTDIIWKGRLASKWPVGSFGLLCAVFRR